MILFFSITLLLVGVGLYFAGAYYKKKPTWRIEYLVPKSKMTLETIEQYKIYSTKISKAYQIVGTLCVVFAFVSYFVGSFELSLALLLIPFLPFSIYEYYCRRIFTGKFNKTAVILLSLAMLAPLAFIVPAYLESSVIINDEKIRITGIYGERIPINQLQQVFLADTLPSIGIRTNGISTGRINKGHFHSRSLGRNVKLLLHSRNAPFLYIVHSDNRHVILNFRNSEKTREVYEQLRGLAEK